MIRGQRRRRHRCRRVSHSVRELQGLRNAATGIRDHAGLCSSPVVRTIPETGLASYPFRDYDTAIGRFLQPEPLGLFAGWENAYAFAMNNPVNFIDPYGLWGWPSISQVVGGIVVAAGVVAAGVAIAAAAPVIAAGGTIGAGIAAAGAALAPVTAAAGAVSSAWLGTATTAVVGTSATAVAAVKAAAIVGAVGGAVVSAATAATTGKGVLGTIGDTVIGGVTGAAAGVASAIGGAVMIRLDNGGRHCGRYCGKRGRRCSCRRGEGRPYGRERRYECQNRSRH